MRSRLFRKRETCWAYETRGRVASTELGKGAAVSYDPVTAEKLWTDPDWTCPMCRFVNFAIRERCRNCGFDSALVSGDGYFPVTEEPAEERPQDELLRPSWERARL